MRKGLILASVIVLTLSFLQLFVASTTLAVRKQIIIGYSSKPNAWDEDEIRAKGGKVKHRYHIIPAIAAEMDEEEIDKIKKKPEVQYVEPDYEVRIAALPNDPLLGEMWALHNTGQYGGTVDADIDAPEAWNIQKGSSNVVIAVIDTGVDYNHEDLAANMWVNPFEIAGDGIDNDGNGHIDDIYGCDFYYHESDPMDDHGHGTHCAGTIGAVSNNGVGVAGINWTTRIMAMKFLGPQGAGTSGNAIKCIEYVVDMKQSGVPVIAMSNSWGGGAFSTPLRDAIIAADNAGILFVAAAGNSANDTDITPFYPASYDVPNVVSVAATDRYDNLAGFSNYGAWSVDLGAPGVSIYSTVLGNDYRMKSGTSMAAPHVSGVAGLIKAEFPGFSHADVKNRILASVDKLGSLTGKVVTGGRLNAFKCLNGNPGQPVAYFVGSPTSGDVPLAVQFTDQSTGEIDSWSWNFGDGGTSSLQNPSHTYNNTGTYTVSLTVTGSGGSDIETKSNYINVVEFSPPVADFVGNPTSGNIPLAVQFTSQSTGQIGSWSWNFGDGGTSSLQNPSHTYSNTGTYTVSLTVTGPGGSDTETKSDYINVMDLTPPLANFVGRPINGDVPLAVQFTDQSTGDIGSWSWDFGDGSTSLLQNPSHTYSSTGTYTVSLGVKGLGGYDAEVKSDYITVTQPSPPPEDGIMYVQNIDFSSKVAGRSGKKSLYITLKVVDENSKPLSDVNVHMTLDLPDGGSPQLSDSTDRKGIVKFTESQAASGTYEATVTNLVHAGYWWDKSKGETSDTCELLDNGGITQSKDVVKSLTGFSLMQNTPNPFNPETWIPYALAKSERVIIRIYDVTGRHVRTLDLGEKPAGTYVSKGKAAYWDGINEGGEKVSSGVYFYVMEAGAFRAAKRMVIAK